jgi:hypothetical protein
VTEFVMGYSYASLLSERVTIWLAGFQAKPSATSLPVPEPSRSWLSAARREMGS